MSKAVIYVRVSSTRQVDNTSLDSQEAACREWCARQGLEVARLFVERGESARTTDRTEFQKMFQYLERSQGSISHLVVDKFDRFSRSVDEGAEYRLKLRRYKIALCSAKEPTDNTAAGKLFSTVLGAFAEYDNDMRSALALTGMKESAEAGRWVWVAPLGYLNGRDRGKPSLIPDPKRAPLMAKLFALVASGKRISDALSYVNDLGLRTHQGKPVPLWTASKQLRNPIYTGIIQSRKWASSNKGDFQPLISEETFLRVQDVLAGRGPKAGPSRRKPNEQFPLRGLLMCPVCQLPVTASASRSETARHYGYYHCHRGRGHLYLRADLVEREFLSLLERLQPNEDRMRLIEAIFRRVWTEKQTTARMETRQLTSELAKLEEKRGRITERMTILDEADFRRLYSEVKESIQRVQTDLIYAQRAVIDVDTALSYLGYLFWNSRNLWENSDLEGKRRLGKLIFPRGVIPSGSGLGTPVVHSIFTLLADESVGEVEMVRPERFELPT